MKRIVSRSLVLAFCLILALPAVAGAAFKTVRTEQLNGTYILGEQRHMGFPSDFFEFSNGSFTAGSRRDGITQGTYSITGDRVEFVHSDGKMYAFQLSLNPNAIRLRDGNASFIFVRASGEQTAAIAARVEGARRLKELGFIAVASTSMNWSDAKAFCRQQGGRLPRINNSDSWDGSGEMNIDGFGASGVPWPSGFPSDGYWTDTECANFPGFSKLVYVHGVFASVSSRQGSAGHVVCIP
jgi:hypothetical protein